MAVHGSDDDGGGDGYGGEVCEAKEALRLPNPKAPRNHHLVKLAKSLFTHS